MPILNTKNASIQPFFAALALALFLTSGGQNLLLAEENPPREALPGEEYFRTLARETWDYLDLHRDPLTGFPTDTQAPGGKTNTTNIGLYLAALGPAVEMNFIAREDALLRARTILAALAKVPSRRGFMANWIEVGGGGAIPSGIQAVSDFNKLAAGLLLARAYFPELFEPAEALMRRVEWDWVYEKSTGTPHYGYDLQTGAVAGDSPWWIASDTRLASFMLIATQTAEPELWDRLARPKIEAGDLFFYGPGYEWGGFFMQAMDGIFLEERASEMGRSAGDFAWHQIRLARSSGLAAWGWSSCNIPGKGYTEGGFIPQWVVTPHASVLAVEYYPRHVLKNLQTLEALGVRAPLEGAKQPFGFRDSFDLDRKIADKRYLSLDQAMIFLSLANYLEGATVRRHFASDPLAARGLKLLGDRLKQDPALLEKWRARDQSEPEASVSPKAALPEIVLDLKNPAESSRIRIESGGTGFAEGNLKNEGLEITFDLGNNASGEADVTLFFPAFDSRGLEEVVFFISGESSDPARRSLGGIRIFLRDDQGQGQYGFIPGIPKAARAVSVPRARRYGIFAKPEAVNQITFKFTGRPWYHTMFRTLAASGNVKIEKIVFEFSRRES